MVCCVLGLGGMALAKDYLYIPTNNALQIVDCETDAVIHTIPGYNAYIIHNFYSEDGSMYYMNDWRNIYAFDVKANKFVATYPFFSDLNRVTLMASTISSDSKYFILSCQITKKRLNIPRLNVLPPQMVIYDIKKREIVKSFETPTLTAMIITLRNDPNTVYAVGVDMYKINISTGEVTTAVGLLNPEEGQEPKNFLPLWNMTAPKDHGMFVGPYYTPTKMGYLVIDRNTGKISTVDADSVELLYSATISPDKKYIYSLMDEIYKTDLATGKMEKKELLEYGTCYSVALTSDGKKVYCGPGGNTLEVFDAQTLKRLGIIWLQGDGVQMTRISY